MFPGKACSDRDARDEARLLGPCHFLFAFSNSRLERKEEQCSFTYGMKDPFSLGDSTYHR